MEQPEALKVFKPTTEGGKSARDAALHYLASIKTKKKAFAELKAIGLFDENGQKNPYFYPDPE